MSDATGPVYESDPDAAPDRDFAPGELAWLVAGNRGRMLDSRRTPIAITEVAPERGEFELEISAFEDRGARWRLPLEEVERFQFGPDAARADDAVLAGLSDAVALFNQPLAITAGAGARAETLRRVAAERERVREWLSAHGPGEPPDLALCVARRRGDGGLYALVEEYLSDRAVAELDRAFAESFVSNPASGELVKGHAIVLAELGLCPYRGKVVRDPDLFAEPWSKDSRATHLLIRLALARELWSSWGSDAVTLYRGAAVDRELRSDRQASFISATFSKIVAEDHFAGGPATQTAVIWRQKVPVARLLMTFVETAALNGRFKEAEALLIGDPENRAF